MKDFIKVDVPNPFQSIYPMQMAVRVEWPIDVEYKGKTYVRMNKFATDLKTGIPCACYKYYEHGTGFFDTIDTRIWLSCNGQITED
jgi:hypothetical protein